MGKSTFLGVFCFLKGAFIWARRWKWLVCCVCQMTNCPQRRFEPFVRWQIIPRDVLSHLSDDKSSPETFWAICQMTNRSQRCFEPFVRWQIIPRDVLGRATPSTLRKMTIWEHLYSGVFAWKGIFMDCHADARNDGLGTWVYKSFFPCSRIKDCICGAKRYG